MKIILKTIITFRCLVLATMFGVAASPLCAQLVDDGAFMVLDNVTNNLGAANLTVGTNGAFTLLVLINGSQVANAYGFIGSAFTANNNRVSMAGLGTVWTNNGDLYVGYYGSENALLISDGARVESQLSDIGFASTASNNQVTVTDPNSLWNSSGGIIVGELGSGNALLITNGSRVLNASGFIIGDFSITTNNQVIVTGPDSFLDNSGGLAVGNGGSFNTLLITNGGWVRDIFGYLGFYTNANHNQVTVTGHNSRWTHPGGDLLVGKRGSENTLLVADGGQVGCNFSSIGFDPGANNNQVTVTDANSQWASEAGIAIGDSGSGNALFIRNSGYVASGYGSIGANSTACSNQVTVTDPNSAWSLEGYFIIGDSGSFNTLLITNGGRVTDKSAVLGGIAASNNQAIVTGPNSLWTSRSNFTVGNYGSFNTLLITNGGRVEDNIGYVGADSWLTTSSNNQVTVTGPNSLWTNTGNLLIGSNSSFNTLVITNGGRVTDNIGYLGYATNARNNQIIVTGLNSLWTNKGDLYLGNFGSFNTLVITNSGRVVSSAPGIGVEVSARNNQVVVTGPNSLWTNAASVYVGERGSGNALRIDDGGRVMNYSGYLGYYSTGTNNQVTVTGSNSVWSCSLDLFVGYTASGNTLVISNGGRVVNFAALIGDNLGANNNQVIVTGPNSVWNGGSVIYAGNSGASNNLLIADGGRVTSSLGEIGQGTSASYNHVIISGPTSIWTNNDFYLGYFGSGNTLLLTNGGAMQSVALNVGFNAGSSNNLFTVDNGTLNVTNAGGAGVLDVRRGTSVLNSGTVNVDRLRLTNTLGFFTLNGGTLKTRNTTNSNGQLFTVGNGTSAAAFELVGNGLHTFANGLTISGNASLRGNGTISGTLTVGVGGTLSPGIPPGAIGRIVLNSPPVLQGSIVMEISRNGATLTNDQVLAAGPLTYGGFLTVSNLGPGALTAGHSFQLFSAPGYNGAFATLSLPALNAGLAWTNKLLVNGSIEVVVAFPKFATITSSGTNVIITGTNGTPNTPYAVLTSTNVAVPLVNWTSIATNQFGPGGEFSFTNGVIPGILQLFYLIRTP